MGFSVHLRHPGVPFGIVIIGWIIEFVASGAFGGVERPRLGSLIGAQFGGTGSQGDGSGEASLPRRHALAAEMRQDQSATDNPADEQ